ncbi:MAG TPA: type 2 isopentenyl-diphosphate Delta-isomerase [Polyangiaceae bacterium]|jgi:isopentenyl-diphosphate delta-isomerase|nr:type 2 isopentenyl-diphosphate Delta-isomerase [Polyangiaceae bacterium]
MANIGQRKADHIALCATDDVGFRRASTLLECVQLVHDALPDLKVADIDLSVRVLGKTLRAPIVIAAMTGGTDEAGRINRELASIAEERGYGFGLGSQRAMHVRPGTGATYRVRQAAPSTLLLGNVGVVQARGMTTAEARVLVDEVGADALCVHLNPAMELVQPGGDRDFSGGLETIARLTRDLGVPVIVKETGCGIAPGVARRLRSVGIQHVDVSGAGGTSWVAVETKRAASEGDEQARALGEALWDWGVPTGASVALLAPLGFETIIATGGIATGLDVARALALGASAAGIARPVLRALLSKEAAASHGSGRGAALAALDAVEAELRAAMLLTGSRDVAALRRAPRVLYPPLTSWMQL